MKSTGLCSRTLNFSVASKKRGCPRFFGRLGLAQQVAAGVALRSRSISSTRCPAAAPMAARLQVMVDLPTPPF
jgi:hypothetical protein